MSEMVYRYEADGAVLSDYVWNNKPGDTNFIIGPLGSGKTFGSCYKMFHLLSTMPVFNDARRSRFFVVRNTYSELMTTVVKDWLSMFEDLGVFKGLGSEPPTHWLDFELEDGTNVKSEIIFISMDRPDDVRKLMGSQLSGVYFSEVKFIPKSIIDHASARVGRFLRDGKEPVGWYGMFGDTNMPDEDHWLYEAAENKVEGINIYQQPGGLRRIIGKQDANGRNMYEPNPFAENMGNTPDVYYTNIQRGKTDEWINVNLCNEWGYVQDGKPVHPEYVDSVHCIDEYTPDPNLPITLGYDFGRTPACALTQLTGMGRHVCFDEFLTDDFSAAQFGPELKLFLDQEYPGFTFDGYGDPAGGSKGEQVDDTCLQIMRASGLPAEKAARNNSTIVRRASISRPLTRNCMDGRPALLITKKAKNIRKGLAGKFCYRRLQVTGERYRDIPDKNRWSHCVEALEYALVGAGEGDAVVAPAKNRGFAAQEARFLNG